MEFFLLDNLETTFWMENLTQRWTPSRPFFQNRDTFFNSWNKAGEAFLLPLFVRLWMQVNMDQYHRAPQNILENAWINCSMSGRWICLIILHVCSKCPRVLNMARLYEYARVTPWRYNTKHYSLASYLHGYTLFWICLGIAQYPSIYLNMLQ